MPTRPRLSHPLVPRKQVTSLDGSQSWAPPPWHSTHRPDPCRGELTLLIRHFNFWHPTFLCCPNTIRTAITEIKEGGGRGETPAILPHSRINMVHSPFPAPVSQMKRTGLWGHRLVLAADIPGPALANALRLHFLAPMDRWTATCWTGNRPPEMCDLTRVGKLAVAVPPRLRGDARD